MRNVIRIFFAIVLCTAIFFTVLFTAVSFVTNDDSFFQKQYIKNNTVDMTEIELDDLMIVTDEIQAYLNDERADFDIYAVLNGVEQAIFTEKEQLHMIDVKNLYLLFSRVRTYSLFFIVILSLYFIASDRYTYWRILRAGSIVTVTAMIVLISAGAFFFEPLFILLHDILFTNALWLLDPNRSVLINLVPQSFFVAFSARIIIYIISIYLTIMILSWVAIVRGRKKNFGKTDHSASD